MTDIALNLTKIQKHLESLDQTSAFRSLVDSFKESPEMVASIEVVAKDFESMAELTYPSWSLLSHELRVKFLSKSLAIVKLFWTLNSD